METRVLFGLVLASLFLSGVQSATFTLKNNCSYAVWPAALSGSGSPPLSSTGFKLASGASSTIDVPAPWSGHFWGRTHCSTNSSGKFVCATADCASGQVTCSGAGGIPPVTLAEFTIKAPGNGKDFFDVSLVDGFNLPLSITPQGGTDRCNSTSCPANVNDVCPLELAMKGNDGSTIACKSACVAFNTPEACCSGKFGTPDKCQPSKYAQLFKSQCPQAYSYAYDDKTSTFTCTGANYIITFCP